MQEEGYLQDSQASQTRGQTSTPGDSGGFFLFFFYIVQLYVFPSWVVIEAWG